MTIQEAKRDIIDFIIEETETTVDVTEQTEVIRGIGLASIEVLHLLGALEDEYDVELSPKIVKNVKTVGELCNLIIDQLRG